MQARIWSRTWTTPPGASGAAVFPNATSENAVEVLRKAVEVWRAGHDPVGQRSALWARGAAGAGTRYAGTAGAAARGGPPPWADLLDLGTELTNSRPYRPQTNGKLERFRRTMEGEIWLQGSADWPTTTMRGTTFPWTEHGETQLDAFSAKKASQHHGKRSKMDGEGFMSDEYTFRTLQTTVHLVYVYII